jgi:hypothetical protein
VTGTTGDVFLLSTAPQDSLCASNIPGPPSMAPVRDKEIMSENTTTDRGVSALHETARWSDGFVMSSTRIPSTVVVPGVTGSETGNGEVEELPWICRRTTRGSHRDHAGVDA